MSNAPESYEDYCYRKESEKAAIKEVVEEVIAPLLKEIRELKKEILAIEKGGK